MSEFKRKLQNEIANPINNTNRTFKTIARVTKSQQKSNCCSIQFIDNEGNVSNKSGVQVRTYTKSIIGWFPKKNDYVQIEFTGEEAEIICLSNVGYGSEIRSELKLKSDIMSTSLIDVSNGFIF